MKSVGKLLSFVYRLVSIPNLVCFSMVQFSCSKFFYNGNWTERSEIGCDVKNIKQVQCEFDLKSQVWFQTIKLHNPKFIWINTRTTRFWLVPSYIEPVAGFSKSETRNMFTSISLWKHVNVMSVLCDCFMWLVVLFYCLILIGWEKDAI